MVVSFPGRRISVGETFYTDWMPRGGDCALFRAQALYKSSDPGTLQVSLETRGAEETSATSMQAYYPASSPYLLQMTTLGIGTAIYVASTSPSSPAAGFKELVRAKITISGGSSNNYWVCRVFSPVYFDNSVPK